MSEVVQQVREFYDQVGWSLVGDEVYQNARYEDLRPVSQEYIHRCHLRVKRHLPNTGKYILDAGSGPIQYPDYLEYSRLHQYRVCADISITALQEARKRIGEHGLYVVCDVTRLPFKTSIFDGVVSLHTFHHVPSNNQPLAYAEVYRVLVPETNAVVVNGWDSSVLMKLSDPLIRLGFRLKGIAGWDKDRWRSIVGKFKNRFLRDRKQSSMQENITANAKIKSKKETRKGTFSQHVSVQWLQKTIGKQIPLEIWVWRSVSVQFLRALIHPRLGGRYLLRMLFWMEEIFPRFFGEKGLYPLIVIKKNGEN